MKKNIIKCIVFVMLVIFVAGTSKPNKVEAYNQIDKNLVACCDQYNNRVVVYDIGENEKKIVKTFQDPAQVGIIEYEKSASPTDAKVRKLKATGKEVVLVTTGTILYVFDYETEKPLAKHEYKFTSLNINVHSIDMSPRGYIYVAEPNTGVVQRYKMDKNYKITYNKKICNLASAHSVLYDTENTYCWATGGNSVYKITTGGNTEYKITVKNDEGVTINDAHCIIQNPKDSNELIITASNGIFTFNKLDSKKQTLFSGFNGVKGLVYYNNKFYYSRFESNKYKDGEEIKKWVINSKGKRKLKKFYKFGDSSKLIDKSYLGWTTTRIRLAGNDYLVFPKNMRVYKIVPFSVTY